MSDNLYCCSPTLNYTEICCLGDKHADQLTDRASPLCVLKINRNFHWLASSFFHLYVSCRESTDTKIVSVIGS